jgi:catechol 2,3-dioxygenase-like lactoylglutathione lyase family enzyme
MYPQRHLKRLHLQSPQASALAHFYARAFGMTCHEVNGTWFCTQEGREVLVSEGQAGQLHYALFVIESLPEWETFRRLTHDLPKANLAAYPELPEACIGFMDPDQNCVVFVLESELLQPLESISVGANIGPLPAAASQHFALRTQQVENMKRFYTEGLGFTLSDVVRDDTGQLKACFVRGNEMHHTLALFGAPVTCFDHQSFETPSWDELKDWADHMGKLRIEIVWGVGRHGPGNDVFFMVRDPDGNLAEISSEIEICTDNRPVGQWKHEERTLNLWGKAIMRS